MRSPPSSSAWVIAAALWGWAASAAAQDPPRERVGAWVEVSGGVTLPGAVDGASSGEAEAGAGFGLRGGYRLLPMVSLGATVHAATLPSEGLPTGNFTFVGLEVAGALPLPLGDAPIAELVGAVAVGYDVAKGTYGDYSGFGGMALRVGVRVPITRWFEAGVDYAVIMPRASETIELDGETYRVEPAWLHQLAVVAVVPFW